jgi:hypothetical protein
VFKDRASVDEYMLLLHVEFRMETVRWGGSGLFGFRLAQAILVILK